MWYGDDHDDDDELLQQPKHLHQCACCALIVTCRGKEDQRYCNGKHIFQLYRCSNCSGFFMNRKTVQELIWMSSIIFSPDADDTAWCDSCDARLIERKDGSSICSGCSRIYEPDSIQKHHMELQPEVKIYDDVGELPVVMMSEYSQPQKKKPSITEHEDKMWIAGKSGRTITDAEEYLPEWFQSILLIRN